MESVNTVGHLIVWSKVNQTIFNILNDSSLGRKKASEAIYDATGIYVSEKLVRTYRKLMADGKVKSHEPVVTLRNGITYKGLDFKYQYDNPSSTSVRSIPTEASAPKTVSRARTIVVMPDVQAPLHDVELVDKFTRFLGDFQPDELAQVGDFTDSTEISRWVRGKKTEYAGDLQAGFSATETILERIREVFSGRFRVVRSNHDDRLELYIESCAPGLASLDALSIENLAGFDKYDVEFIRDEVVELTPGADSPWIMAHGDEGSLSPVAGRTAFALAKNKFGANVVCGHTHRAGLTSESHGYNGKIRDTRYGLEVGHFMDITKADYLKKKGVAMNWQQAFGILYIHGDKVYPQLITVNDGNFSVEGKLY